MELKVRLRVRVQLLVLLYLLQHLRNLLQKPQPQNKKLTAQQDLLKVDKRFKKGLTQSMEEKTPIPESSPEAVVPKESSHPSAPDIEKPKKRSKIWFLIPLVIVLTVLVLGGLFAYGKSSQDKENAEVVKELYKGKITIGYSLWPGYLALYIARDKGYFKEAGLDVGTKNYATLTESYDDYRTGKIQGVANLSLDVVNAAYKGLDNKIVVVVDYSNGSDGIIASKDIKEIKDIKGKKVAFEHDTLEEFFLKYALEENNLTLKDITPVNLGPEKSAEALVEGKVDVAVTYEPFMSQALSKNEGNKIYSSKEAPGLITDTITFRSDFIDQNPDTVEAFLIAYFKAVEFWKSNPDEGHAILAKELGVTKEEAVEQLAGINILDLQDNKVAFTYDSGLASIYGNMNVIKTFIEAQQPVSSVKISTDLLIEPKFIRGLSN